MEQLEDQIVDARLEPDIVNRADVRVVERGDCVRFALEALPPVRVAGDRGKRHFDRHVPSETGVPGPEQLAHPPGAERPDDFIGAEPGAWRERRVERRRDT